MALPRPPAGLMHVAVSGVYGSTEWANTFWCLTTGYDTATGPDLASVANQFYSAYLLNLHALAVTDCDLTECKCVLYQSDTELQAIHASSDPGSNVGNLAPANVASLITWGIASYYRGGHPRTYLPGCSTTDMNGVKQWTNTYVGNLTTAAANFLTAVNAITTTTLPTVTLGVLRRYSGGVPLTPPVFYPYFSATGQLRVCTQRRRLGREF